MAGGQQEHFHDWHSDVLAAALASRSLCASHLHPLQGEDHWGEKGGRVDRAVLHCTLSGNRAAYSNVRLNTVSFAFNAAARSTFLPLRFCGTDN